MTLGNTDGEISGLTISNPPTQAEVQALRDKCEELADDVRALSTLIHALRTALVGAAGGQGRRVSLPCRRPLRSSAVRHPADSRPGMPVLRNRFA